MNRLPKSPRSGSPDPKKREEKRQKQQKERDQFKTDFYSMFQGTPYADSPELKNVLDRYLGQHNPYGYRGGTEGFKSDVKTTLDQYLGTFNTMFKNQVGRDPTAEEFNTFIDQVVIPEAPWATAANLDLTKQHTRGLLSDVFSGAAQEETQRKAQSAAEAAVAPGSAFDRWANQYRDTLGGVEKSLADYQTRIMEKIRPNLLLSLKSQGLLDSGGLNEAFAGKAKDLTQTASDYMTNARTGVEQDIANQKYNLLSLPYQQQAQYTMGQIPNLLTGGQSALQNTWNNYLQDKSFNQQMQLLNAQNSDQPSLLQQYGGLMIGNTVGGLGQGWGYRMAGGKK